MLYNFIGVHVMYVWRMHECVYVACLALSFHLALAIYSVPMCCAVQTTDRRVCTWRPLLGAREPAPTHTHHHRHHHHHTITTTITPSPPSSHHVLHITTTIITPLHTITPLPLSAPSPYIIPSPLHTVPSHHLMSHHKVTSVNTSELCYELHQSQSTPPHHIMTPKHKIIT